MEEALLLSSEGMPAGSFTLVPDGATQASADRDPTKFAWLASKIFGQGVCPVGKWTGDQEQHNLFSRKSVTRGVLVEACFVVNTQRQ
jgi:hypothetical protein